MDSIAEVLQHEYLLFIITLIITVIILFISLIILRRIIHTIGGKKKTFTKQLFRKIAPSVFFIIFLCGLYISLQSLSMFSSYHQVLNDVFFVIITLLFAFLVARITNIFLGTLLKIRKGLKRTPHLISNFFSIIIYIIALVIILGYFRLDITPLIAGVGVGALAIGLALQSTLANFFAGLHILSDQPIRVGDFIELDENTQGFVEDIGWRSTRIKTMTDNLIIIPNEKLANTTILNYSMPKQDMYFYIPCGVAYESDLQKVEQITLEVAKDVHQTVPGAVKDADPIFRYSKFDDSNIDFIAIIRVEEPMKRYPVRNEFIKRLKKRFDQEGIEISWPIRKLYNVK